MDNWCLSTASTMQKRLCAIIIEVLLFSFGNVVLNLETEFENFQLNISLSCSLNRYKPLLFNS